MKARYCMAGRMYEMAFRLNAKLGKSYNSAFSRAEEVASKTFNKIAKLGATVLGGIGIADMANTYKDFQQSIANTGAIAGVPKGSKEFKALETAALEAGKKTTKTAQEAADALGYMSLAGWTTEQSISGLMPVLRASEATGADLAVTSDLVTDSMSAMGVGVEQLTEYLDMAAAANNKSNQNMLELMEAIIGSGGAARAAGVNMYDLSTALGVLADNGLKGAEGGTAMNSMLVRMTTHDKALKTMKSLGVEVFDANKNFRGLEAILTDLNTAMAGMGTEDITANLKAIAGTNYYSQFEYLLDAIKEGSAKTDEFSTRWKEFNTELHNSKGALEQMAEAMNDTFGSALAILGSASDDMKIQIMKEIEPTITPIIRGLADSLPELSVKISSFIKSGVRDIKGLWKSVSPFFDKLDFNKIKVGIMGIAGAFAAAKIVNKILSIKKSVGDLFAIIRANPIALVIEAIVALGVALYEAGEQAEDANLAEHFGKITLSAEQLDSVAKNIVGSKRFVKLGEALDIKEKLKSSEKTLQDYISSINSMNFKVKMGVQLDIDEQEQYKKDIANYIEGVRNFLLESQQSDLLLFDGNETMTTALNAFYSRNEGELKQLGEDLNKAVTEAFNDGLLEPNEIEAISRIQNAMAEIQSKMAKSKTEAKIEVLTNQLISGEVTSETFNAFTEQLNTEVETVKEKLSDSLAEKLSSIEMAFNAKDISKETMEKQKQEAWSSFNKDIAEISEKAFSMVVNTMYDKYGPSIELARRETFVKDYNGGKIDSATSGVLEEFYEEMEPMAKTLEENQNQLDKNSSLYKGINDSLYKFGLIGVAGDTREIFGMTTGGKRLVEKYKGRIERKTQLVAPEIEKAINENNQKRYAKNPLVSPKIEETIKKYNLKNGINLKTEIPVNAKAKINQEVINKSVNKSREYLKKGLEQPMNAGITADATVSAGAIDTSSFENSIVSSVVSSLAGSLQKAAEQASKIRVKKTGPEKPSGKISLIQGFATGSEYTPDTFIAGEKGAELITGSKGRKVFTALETGNIFSNIGKIKDTLVSAVGAVNVFDKLRKYDTAEENEGMKPERVVKPSKTVNNSSNFSVTVNNEIKIDGADSKDNDNLKDLIDRVLRKGTGEMIEKVKEAVISAIEMENERKVRLQNE